MGDTGADPLGEVAAGMDAGRDAVVAVDIGRGSTLVLGAELAALLSWRCEGVLSAALVGLPHTSARHSHSPAL